MEVILMDERRCRYYEKVFKEDNPMRLSPYERSRPYKEGKRGTLTNK